MMKAPCQHTAPQQDCAWCDMATTRDVRYARLWWGLELDGPTGPTRSHRAVSGPCRHLGAATGVLADCATCRGRVQLKLFSCALHQTCTPSNPVRGTTCCASCPDRTPVYPPMRWVSTAQLIRDSITLAGLLPADVTAVAGIPRSGMLPASVIATHLHLPLFQLTPGGGLSRLGHGRGGSLPQGLHGRLAVIDDTVYSGDAMHRARIALGALRAVYGAVYVTHSAGVVDLFVEEVKELHLLEWNLLNNGPLAGHAASPLFGAGVGLDLDGVICHDEHSGGKVGTPYLLPRSVPAPLICTGRPEAQRAATEAQLRLWGVRWQRLEMFPGDTQPGWKDAAAHKAWHYQRSALGFFVESCPQQAEAIHRQVRKPVICPREERVWS